MRVFLAGLRHGERWSGDSEIYKAECVEDIFRDLVDAVAEIEKSSADYWNQ